MGGLGWAILYFPEGGGVIQDFSAWWENGRQKLLLRPILPQQLGNFRVLHLDGEGKRRATLGVLDLHVRLPLQQQAHRREGLRPARIESRLVQDGQVQRSL